jgi:hypothetical protein
MVRLKAVDVRFLVADLAFDRGRRHRYGPLPEALVPSGARDAGGGLKDRESQ